MKKINIYRNVSIVAITTAFLISAVLYFGFQLKNIAVGILVGCGVRLLGFLLIILTFKVHQTNPLNTFLHYSLRLVLYGILLGIALHYQINVVGIIIGLTIFNGVLYVAEFIQKQEVADGR